MDVIWLSANQFGCELLKQALELHEIRVIRLVTLAEGSKTRMYDGVNPSTWRAFNIPVIETTRIDAEVERLNELAPDLIVMAGWRQILPTAILRIPKRGVVSFHPTLLPKGRGPAPIINSILEGYQDSGVTMFYVDGGVDTGDIIDQERFTIGAEDYASDLYARVIAAGRQLVSRNLPLIALGHAPRTPQDESQATHFAARSLSDNEIHSTDSHDLKCRKVRALSRPYAGAFLVDGAQQRTIWKVEDLPEPP